MVKVSVVVPVFNPGSSIDACIASLLRQTLPPEEFEVIFVNDGSTDDTLSRLEPLTLEHPQLRVITIPNSGWPGKPRNVGVAAARGEYVQFLDQDDHLASGALERLSTMGRRNGSDIVIGKVASNFRGVPHGGVQDRPREVHAAQRSALRQPHPAQDVPDGLLTPAPDRLPRGQAPARGPAVHDAGVLRRRHRLHPRQLHLLLLLQADRRQERRLGADRPGRLLRQFARGSRRRRCPHRARRVPGPAGASLLPGGDARPAQ